MANLVFACLLVVSSVSALTTLGEVLNASDVHDACVAEHGDFYKIVSSTSGFVFPGGYENETQGAMVVRSTIGGSCEARIVEACNISDPDCDVIVNCTADGGNCFDCVPARFKGFAAAKVKFFADCNGTTPFLNATDEEKQEVLDGIKEAVLNCGLKGCRYFTENPDSVRVSTRRGGTRVKIFTRRKADARRLKECSALREVIFTENCRFSARPLPF
eukprot:m.293155 g.293155  ORF g.293155 m.293155 type:complete len:217 (+) comp18649_c0_seq1:146-796(+)